VDKERQDSKMSEGLKDRVVLITGASGALGSVVVREFARTEALLALTSRSPAALHELAAHIDLPEERVAVLRADVTQIEGVDALIKDVIDRFGRLDVLLNTVGAWSGGTSVAETSADDWEHMLSVNLRSAFLLSRAVLPHMLGAGWGRIIHVSSKTAVEPRAKQVGYAVSKMGLITLTEVIAAEVKGTGVTANVLLPSIIDTPANRAGMPKANPKKWVPSDHITAMMRFLCSDAGATINGAGIPMYGAV
jgi:NAD(P)-dependent dehydrogenase (short-subunit alcohol dehydrogenase family)